ncbi:hypothetical protein A6035_00985 [Dietzia lutea]|uniref:SsuA/THI5-like domain-containing protein n=1 Tax=Dietzia lutea TaxID=546160 RepID=A0A2S1R3X0_9ACTN|nr:hypothetical protein A6035_00985 [Dietzia lutea]
MPSFVPMYLAQQLGYTQDAGIELDTVAMERGAGPIIAALSNGSVDVAVQSPAVLAAANESGADLRFFCGSAQLITSVILTKPDSGIQEATADDWQSAVRSWKGKTLGIPTLEGAVTYTVRSLIEEAGLAPDDVELVAVGVGEGAFQTLQSDEIDLLFSFPFFTEQWTERSTVVFDWAEDAPEEMSEVMQTGWMSTKGWLDSNPETASNFCDAMTRGVEGVLTESDATREILSDRYSLSGAPIEAAMSEDGPMASQSTELDCATTNRALTAAKEAGLLQREHTCEDVVWDQKL